MGSGVRMCLGNTTSRRRIDWITLSKPKMTQNVRRKSTLLYIMPLWLNITMDRQNCWTVWFPEDSIRHHLAKCLSWWRHQMETFYALLALCAGNSPGTGELVTPVTRSFDVFFDLNGRLNKQSWGWWFETPSRPLWRHSNVFWEIRFPLFRYGLEFSAFIKCCIPWII